MPPPRPGRPSAGPLPGQLQSVLEPIVAGAGFELDELDVRAAGRRHTVKVVVDSDTGVGLDDIARLSPRRRRRARPARAPHRRLVHPRGHLAWRRPAAHGAAALAAGPAAPGHRAAARRQAVHRSRRRGGGGRGHDAGRRRAAGGPLRRRRARRGPGGVQARARVRGGAACPESGGHRSERRHRGPARHRARQGHPLRYRARGDRDRAAHRLQAHRRPRAARPHRHRPQDRARAGDGPGRWPRTAPSPGSGTTPPRASAGSPPPPPAR